RFHRQRRSCASKDGGTLRTLTTTRRLVALLAGVTLATLPPAGATTIAPPKDLGALLQMSDAVVFARALQSWVEPTDSVPLTVTRFQVERVLAGVIPGSEFQVQEIGGHWNGLTTIVAGSPSYVIGSRYLLFLRRGPGPRWGAGDIA